MESNKAKKRRPPSRLLQVASDWKVGLMRASYRKHAIKHLRKEIEAVKPSARDNKAIL